MIDESVKSSAIFVLAKRRPTAGASGGTLACVVIGHVVHLAQEPYTEAVELQRVVAARVSDGSLPDTVLLLEHPPVITLGRRADAAAELHIPAGVDVDLVETNRGGKSTYHGPGQLVCYPILDLRRHGQDVKRYVRMLERALIDTVAAFGIEATRLDGDNMAGVWLERPPRKIASIGVHVSRWITTHGYALNVDLDTAPFTEWITACGLADAAFTTMTREAGRALGVDDVRPYAADALAAVFDLALEPLSRDDLELKPLSGDTVTVPRLPCGQACAPAAAAG